MPVQMVAISMLGFIVKGLNYSCSSCLTGLADALCMENMTWAHSALKSVQFTCHKALILNAPKQIWCHHRFKAR